MSSILYDLQKELREDLARLEYNNLKEINEARYTDLKERFENLDKRLSTCDNDNPGNTLPLKMEYAKISADLDFYLTFLNGSNEVYAYKTSKIKEALENLLKRLDSNNYKEVEQELNDTLAFYKSLIDTSINALEVVSLIDEIRYGIFKQKMESQIVDDTFLVREYLVYILKDIRDVVDNPNVSTLIKDRLKKYLIDKTSIVNDYKIIAILINLSSRSDITEERIDFELNERKYYHSNDLEKDYKSIDNVKGYSNIDQLEASKIYGIESMEFINRASKTFIAKLSNNSNESVIRDINYLNKIGFQNWLLVFKGIIIERSLYFVHYFKSFKEILLSLKMNDVADLMDVAIIAYMDEFNKEETLNLLSSYAINTNNEYIIRYMLQKNSSYFNRDQLEIIIESNNWRLLEALENTNNINIMADYLQILESKGKDYKRQLDRYLELSGYNEEQKKGFLMACLKGNNIYSKPIYLEKLAEYNDSESFIILIKNAEVGRNILYIFDHIKNPKIKEDVANYIYREIDRICEYSYTYDKKDKKFWDLEQTHIDNRFSAYFASKKMSINTDINNINALICEYGSLKLDWTRILLTVYHDKKEKLSDEVLEIYCAYYEKKLAEENVTLEEQIEKILPESAKGRLELIVYLAHKGLNVGNMILNYGLNDTSYQDIYIEAIKNCKDSFNRLYYYQRFMAKNNELSEDCPLLKITSIDYDYDVIFLSNEELEEMKKATEGNPEKINALEVRLRKYYWDLVKLLGQVQDLPVKRRIVMYVARSNYKEHINYIATNYGEYLDLLMENVTDYNIQTDLMSLYNENMMQWRK